MMSLRAPSAARVLLASRPTAVRAFRSSVRVNALSVGDKLPDVTLYGDTPGDEVKSSEAFGGKKVVVFGVPGAFTPGCSKSHLPSFLTASDDFKEAGADMLVCTAVNDPFVMSAWGKDQGCDGKVSMLADTQMELTKALGIEMDASAKLGNVRCKRFSMVLDDNTIKALNVEPEDAPGGMTVSMAEPTLEGFKAL